ncbi:MAG: DUF4190 domain-containing protein [Defluviitaleaceae bacterium]|nr:DUF4190 domain-containing protein [Defluviitaleaceae bacterium]
MNQFPNQQDGFPTPPPAPAPEQGKGLAIASLILGCIGLVFSWLMGFAGLPALIGLILAIVAKKKGFSGGLGTAGLIVSIVAIVLNLIIFIACSALILYEMSYWM